MRVDQAKRSKELEAENARLKRVLPDLTVDRLRDCYSVLRSMR
jgi:hypothetical protein